MMSSARLRVARAGLEEEGVELVRGRVPEVDGAGEGDVCADADAGDGVGVPGVAIGGVWKPRKPSSEVGDDGVGDVDGPGREESGGIVGELARGGEYASAKAWSK